MEEEGKRAQGEKRRQDEEEEVKEGSSYGKARDTEYGGQGRRGLEGRGNWGRRESEVMGREERSERRKSHGREKRKKGLKVRKRSGGRGGGRWSDMTWYRHWKESWSKGEG